MITIKQRFAILAAILISSAAFAQTVAVKGRVTDESGEPLAGASVIILNTSTGETTDIDGNYSINAAENATLEFSFLGFETQTVQVGKRNRIDVVLVAQNNTLDELVVVGYGVQKKVNLTGAVAAVDYQNEIKSRPVATTAQALQGLSTGVQVIQSSGKPGEESVTIRVRGVGTLNNASPLVIVDGFEGALDAVNPDDIKSISVLKDAASCAIYGNRGANGVILVTTKAGEDSKGKFSVSYSGMMAINEPASRFKVVSNYADYMSMMNESAENVDKAKPFSQEMIELWREKEKDPYGIADSGYPNYVAYPNTDWMDAIYNKGIYHKHNISASGSAAGTKYLISMSYIDNPGIIDNSASRKFQLRANISSQVTKWLEIGTKIWGYESTSEVNDINGSFGFLSRAVPGIYPYYDGKYGWMENSEQDTNSRNNLYFFNNYGGKNRGHYVNAAVFANVKLPFDIRYHVSFNYGRLGTENRYYRMPTSAFSFRRGEVAYKYNDLNNMINRQRADFSHRWTFQNNLSWAKTFAKKHDVSAMIGYEAMYYNMRSSVVEKKKADNDQLTELNNFTDMTSITGNQYDFAAASVFGRVTYAYDSRYLFEANLRYDGSSRFARQSRWGLFPSLSAGWRISQEEFMKNTGVDNLKLRASWGKLGNNSIDNYEYQSTYATGYEYSFGNKLSAGMVSTLSNNALTWETTTSTDIGLELGVLNNRLNFETDFYNKVTDGILYKAPIFATVGTKEAPSQNLCEVINRGIELSLEWKDDIGDFSYGIKGNFTRNWNVVSKYKGALEAAWVTDKNGHRSYQSNIGSVATGTGDRRVMEGKIINEYYIHEIYKGSGNYFFADGSVNPAGGPKDGMIRTPEDMTWLEAMINAGNTFLPNKTIGKNGIWYGDYIYADANGDGVYGNDHDKLFQGKGLTPKFYYGFQFDLAWKGIDFSMLWSGAGGGACYWRYAGFNCYSTDTKFTIPKEIGYDHYFFDPENPDDPRTNLTSKHGRLTMNYQSEQNGGGILSNLFLYKTDYLRLKNLTLGYTFPNKWMKKIHVKDLRLFFSGENLATFTNYPGMDPEMGSTSNYYALLRQYTFGLSIKF